MLPTSKLYANKLVDSLTRVEDHQVSPDSIDEGTLALRKKAEVAKAKGDHRTYHTLMIQYHQDDIDKYGVSQSHKSKSRLKAHKDALKALQEDAPTNNVGGGAIPGTGNGPNGEAIVRKKASNKYKEANAKGLETTSLLRRSKPA